MNSTLKMLGLIAIGILAGTVLVYAATNWTGNGGWNLTKTLDYTVWSAENGGIQYATPYTIPDFDPPQETEVLDFYIQNDGNVDIKVIGTVTVLVGSATAEWTPTSGEVTIPKGTTRSLLTLTLSEFSGGAGQFTIQFVSVESS